jgi:hypothetical protein
MIGDPPVVDGDADNFGCYFESDHVGCGRRLRKTATTSECAEPP